MKSFRGWTQLVGDHQYTPNVNPTTAIIAVAKSLLHSKSPIEPSVSDTGCVRYRGMSVFVNFLLTSALHRCVQEAAYASIKLEQGSARVGFDRLLLSGMRSSGRDDNP
jgi:hypothetical protein